MAAITMEATVDSALPAGYGDRLALGLCGGADLANPKLVEAPVLTRAGRPDLKIYGSLFAAEACAEEV